MPPASRLTPHQLALWREAFDLIKDDGIISLDDVRGVANRRANGGPFEYEAMAVFSALSFYDDVSSSWTVGARLPQLVLSGPMRVPWKDPSHLSLRYGSNSWNLWVEIDGGSGVIPTIECLQSYGLTTQDVDARLDARRLVWVDRPREAPEIDWRRWDTRVFDARGSDRPAAQAFERMREAMLASGSSFAQVTDALERLGRTIGNIPLNQGSNQRHPPTRGLEPAASGIVVTGKKRSIDLGDDGD